MIRSIGLESFSLKFEVGVHVSIRIVKSLSVCLILRSGTLNTYLCCLDVIWIYLEDIRVLVEKVVMDFEIDFVCENDSRFWN